MIGAIIALAAWGIVLAWLIGTLVRIIRLGTLVRIIRREREQCQARRLMLMRDEFASDEQRRVERERRERLRRQQRQIEALDALYELPSPSHRGGRTR